jgi:hypothetical protein
LALEDFLAFFQEGLVASKVFPFVSNYSFIWKGWEMSGGITKASTETSQYTGDGLESKILLILEFEKLVDNFFCPDASQVYFRIAPTGFTFQPRLKVALGPIPSRASVWDRFIRAFCSRRGSFCRRPEERHSKSVVKKNRK